MQRIFDSAAYGTTASVTRLERLWTTDYLPVSKARSNGLPLPATFVELQPFVDEAVSRIENSEHGPVRVVNAEPGMEEQAPDFDRESVWSVLVGGAKLSRGFTVEGLTISYFRRRVRTADTLMQTGRWFGFRQGYQDLVRVFFGRDEPDGPGHTFDLLAAFKAICMDEEMFRAQLRRYVELSSDGSPITPKQIPPLVSQHLLQPSATNKMYNAVIQFMNFGASWAEQTRLPTDADRLKDNADLFRALFARHELVSRMLGAKDRETGKTFRWTSFIAEVPPPSMVDLLARLAWVDNASGYVRECEYLRGTGPRDPGIRRWLVIAPQKVEDAPVWRCGPDLKVFQRVSDERT